MLTLLKKSIHFKIAEAESGEDALKEMNRNNFDVMIVDYQMPVISGGETIYRILDLNQL